MALERGIALLAFAVGLTVVVVALVGCGDDDTIPVNDEPLTKRARLPAEACNREGTREHGFFAEQLDTETGEVRAVYRDSGSAVPCAASVEIDGSEVRVTLHVLDPDVLTADVHTHCVRTELVDLPQSPDIVSAEGEGDTFVADFDAVRRLMARSSCKPIPVLPN